MRRRPKFYPDQNMVICSTAPVPKCIDANKKSELKKKKKKNTFFWEVSLSNLIWYSKIFEVGLYVGSLLKNLPGSDKKCTAHS